MNQKIKGGFAKCKKPLAFALASCFVMLAGCKADTAASAAPGSQASNRSGVLKTSVGNYEFTPTTCGLHREDDFDDIEIQGPGVAPDGEVFYFELSSTGEEMSVNLGVDNFFSSSERRLTAGRWTSEPYTIQTSGKKFTVSDIVLVDGDGARIDGAASLEIDCETP